MADALDTQPIPRLQFTSKKSFVKDFIKPQKPVIFENLTEDWEALSLWNFQYFKSIAGDITVPLYNSKPITSKYKYNEPQARMKFDEYIDLLLSQPTDLRLFLFNLIKERPELQDHIKFPEIGLKLIKSLPFLFVGGQGSKVFMHYDIDLANILHIHLYGEKECLIFPPSETKYLYKVPNSLKTHDGIDFSNPDFSMYPALKLAKGYKAKLKPGDVLYMPEAYWHYMHYITPGFSISLRALARHPKHLFQGIYNVTIMRLKENLMREFKGDSWIEQKQKEAISKTHKGINL